MPAKTATGTIAIEVEGSNEQCPTLTSNFQTMCTRDDAVIVNAVDKDAYPNGPPFDFKIISGGTGGKWQVEHLNGEEPAARWLRYGGYLPCVLHLEQLLCLNRNGSDSEDPRVSVAWFLRSGTERDR